jgi:lysozyme family protein
MARATAKAKAKTASRNAKKKRKSAPRKKTGCAKCKKKTCDQLYEKHKKTIDKAKENGKFKGDIAAFKKHYEANKSRYEAVADQTGVPAPLIAAIHWREGSGNFGTYLHQGDPLGKPPTHVPTNIPTFGKNEWEKAAAHAINQKKACRDALKMDKNTTDRAKMAAYAERYNGLGYDNKGVTSPYVYSGTDAYSSGKYVADHVYSSSAVDKQVGVIPLVDSVSP